MTPDPKPDDFADLREALAKATPGPWTTKRANAPVDDAWDYAIGAEVSGRTQCIGEMVGRCSRADFLDAGANAAFIARARNRLPALLATLDQRTAALTKAKADIARLVEGLKPFAAAGAVADFYVEDVCPPLAWPVLGTRTDPDGPPPVVLGQDPFRHARSLIAEFKETDDGR